MNFTHSLDEKWQKLLVELPPTYRTVPLLPPDWIAGQQPGEPLRCQPIDLLLQLDHEIVFYGSSAEIRRALSLFLPVGAVTEIRILEGRLAGENDNYGSPASFFGFFSDVDALVRECCRIVSARGVYFLPNAIDPQLQARGFNRFRRGKQRGPGQQPEESAGNNDVLRRRFILLDVDSPSPRGTAATDEERGKCWTLVCDILSWLNERDFPPGIIVSSGNGFQVAFPADLPADDGDFSKELVHLLADRFDGDGSRGHVDRACHNPARIWRLPGLPNRKGDNVPALGRIHRMAHLIAVPAAQGGSNDHAADDSSSQGATGDASAGSGTA